MTQVVCSYYRTESGRAPAEEFIDSLDVKSRDKYAFVFGLLEEHGRQLKQPYAKYIGDEIFELRFLAREGAIRVLYFFYHGGKAILANGFIKKTDKTPTNEKETAIQRRNNYFKRKEAEDEQN